MRDRSPGMRAGGRLGTVLLLLAPCLALPFEGEGQNQARAGTGDPRIGLRAGWMDAEAAAWNMELVSHRDRPEGFFDSLDPGSFDFANSDLAFRGTHVFAGSYAGFNVYDIANPASPELRISVACPGGQGDLSIYGDLLFMSVEQTRGRVDCGLEGTPIEIDPARFRGVRIFDVRDVERPVQVAAVQTCRGSHTHTLVPHPTNDRILYVYVSGTSTARSGEELAGCVPITSPDEPNTSYWSIGVIEVPLDAPEDSRLVAEPRVFADSATGSIAGLWPGGDHGPGTQVTRETIQCHDITAYPEIGLAAGACSGNGLLFDISDPLNPVRVDEVSDTNFSYWHSATFNNDGTKVIFTDEWGGGSAPRCQATDPPTWGANAVFNVVNRKLLFAGYYKLPAPQTETENCVAHNGSLVPVPGRDIKVQAWYQGGVSVFDFTDPERPFEIAYLDRGPVSETELMLGGYWSTYWYNGFIYGSEIARGLDVLRLAPGEFLTQNELDAANLVRQDEFNPQNQPHLAWPAAFPVARAYLDQLIRAEGVPTVRAEEIAAELARIEAMGDGEAKRSQLANLAIGLWEDARRVDEGAVEGDEARIRALAGAILDLAAAQP
ncbi:MAG: hypothetical protein WEG36_10110 [Gemmatimonadota bacterium]